MCVCLACIQCVYVCVVYLLPVVSLPASVWMLQCVCALGLLDPTLGCLILRLFGGKVQPRGGWGRDCLSEAIKQLAGCQVRAQKSTAMHCR